MQCSMHLPTVEPRAAQFYLPLGGYDVRFKFCVAHTGGKVRIAYRGAACQSHNFLRPPTAGVSTTTRMPFSPPCEG